MKSLSPSKHQIVEKTFVCHKEWLGRKCKKKSTEKGPKWLMEMWYPQNNKKKNI